MTEYPNVIYYTSREGIPMNKYYHKYKIEKVKEKRHKRKCNLCYKEVEMGIFERFCKHCKTVARKLDTANCKVNLY